MRVTDEISVLCMSLPQIRKIANGEAFRLRLFALFVNTRRDAFMSHGSSLPRSLADDSGCFSQSR